MINSIIKQVVGMLNGKGLMKINCVVHGRNTGKVLGRKLLVLGVVEKKGGTL